MMRKPIRTAVHAVRTLPVHPRRVSREARTPPQTAGGKSARKAALLCDDVTEPNEGAA